MTRITNELKLKSVGGDSSKIVKNSYGEWDTTGARTSGGVKGVKSFLSEYGMKVEGKQLSTGFDDPFNRFINKVSKTHDFQNSWHYNWDTGFFQPFTNQIGAEAFEIYSFLGMPIAGVYTAAAIGSDQILLTSQIYGGRR